MPTERTSRRQFNLTQAELIQFLALPGISPATPRDLAPSALIDLWHGPNRGAGPYVSSQLTTREILAKLQPQPSHLEVTAANRDGYPVILVTQPESGKQFELEATLFGMQSLVGILQRRSTIGASRQSNIIPLQPYVPSDWIKLGFGQGKDPRQFTARGKPIPSPVNCLGVSLSDLVD